MRRSLPKVFAAIAVLTSITSSGIATGNMAGNYNRNPPKDIVFVSHRSHDNPNERTIIAINARDIAEHIKHGDWLVPFNNDILKGIGWEDSGM